jgi:hypothetical protein
MPPARPVGGDAGIKQHRQSAQSLLSPRHGREVFAQRPILGSSARSCRPRAYFSLATGTPLARRCFKYVGAVATSREGVLAGHLARALERITCCDLRVNEYAAYSRRQLFANAAIAASRGRVAVRSFIRPSPRSARRSARRSDPIESRACCNSVRRDG